LSTFVSWAWIAWVLCPDETPAVLGQVFEFRPSKFFLFSGGAKFGEFRPGAPAQVVCGSLVGVKRWGEIV
jgi:hypothetical protein